MKGLSTDRFRLTCLAGLVLLMVLVALVALGCGATGKVGDAGTVSTTQGSESTTITEETTTTAVQGTSTTQAQDTTTVKVYFSRGDKIGATSRIIPQTLEVGAAAMKALLDGPDTVEEEAGMASNIPEGTTFLGLVIDDGIATVDLSKEYASGGGSLSMFMRLAEVVFTLTQFPTVDGVNFKLDGEAIDVLGGEGIIIDHPMSRFDFEDLSPAILVESPTVGETIRSPVRITGTANVFEAVFRVNIVDPDGLIIADEDVKATSGTGDRGTFDVTISFALDQTGPGALVVFWESAEDGSPVDVVEIPLQLDK